MYLSEFSRETEKKKKKIISVCVCVCVCVCVYDLISGDYEIWQIYRSAEWVSNIKILQNQI